MGRTLHPFLGFLSGWTLVIDGTRRAANALIAAFRSWGWDVTSNPSEETRDSRRTAGPAGLVGVGIVFRLGR